LGQYNGNISKSINLSWRVCYTEEKVKKILMKHVTIYSTPTCVYCRMAKEFFAKNNVSYTDYNVASDMEKRQEMIDKSEQMGVPVIDIENNIIVGCNEKKIKELLGL
jgi:glutaredoxin 3